MREVGKIKGNLAKFWEISKKYDWGKLEGKFRESEEKLGKLSENKQILEEI